MRAGANSVGVITAGLIMGTVQVIQIRSCH